MGYSPSTLATTTKPHLQNHPPLLQGSKTASSAITRYAPITTTPFGISPPHLIYIDSPQPLEHSLTNRGEHIHHGYFLDPADSKEVAQARLIDLLIERSELVSESQVLDVGCGIGGTSRYLARKMGCSVTGVTISGQQVKLARDLSEKEAGPGQGETGQFGFIRLGDGSVRFLELDAEKMGDFFTEPATKATFDCVWISEAMSHLPDKELFFRNASMLLNADGKLVVADWFKAEGLTDAQMEADIKPIEGENRFEMSVGMGTDLRRWNASSWTEYAVGIRRIRKAGWAQGVL